MKIKAIVLASVLTLTCAASSFAITWLSGQDVPPAGAPQSITITGNAPAFAFKPSSNVQMGYAFDTTAPGATYIMASYHVSGTFVYAASSVDTGIYRKESGNNTTRALVDSEVTVPAAPTSSTASVDWTAGAWTLSK